MKKKNTKQYFDGGNILSLLGGLSNVIPSDNTAGGAAGGAIKGASSMATTGNPYLIGAGALLGGINGGIQGYKQNMDNQINPFTDGVNQRNQMLNIMADGGFLTSFDGGYTHDDPNPNNVNGGIPQGTSPDGRLNTVEKGEAKEENFVYSNNPDFIITKDMIKGTNLPDYVIGKTPAEAARMINDKLKDNPNNEIVKETTEIFLNQLKVINTNLIGETSVNEFDNGGPITIDPNVNVDSLNNVNYQRQQDYLKSQYGIDPQVEHYSFPNMEFYSRVPSQEEVARMDSAFQANLLNTNKLIDSLQNVVPEPIPYPKSPATTKQAVLDWIKNGKVGPMPRVGYKNGGTIQHATDPWLNLQTKSGNFNKINPDPYNRETVFYPSVNGLPPFEMLPPTGPTGKRWSIEYELQYAKTPEDRAAALFNFSKRSPSEWGYYANQAGQEIAGSGIPAQDINGRFAGGVTPEHLSILYPNIFKQVSPDGSLNWDDAKIDKFQKLYNEANYNKMMELDPNNPTYSSIGGDWLRGMDLETPPPPKPPDLLNKLPQRDFKLPQVPLDTTLKPVNKTMNVESPGTPGLDTPVPNLWPEAGLLQALPYLGLKPNLADPTLMSTGYLKPQLVDEMSMRAGIDQANRANTGALANVTGGSASAQRAGLLGNGANYMNAINNAFIQSNQANNQARMAADQFNIQNQTGVAGQNMGALNQFELENKELINNINAKKADEFSNAWANYVENGYRRRAAGDLERARRNEIEAFTGYNIPSSQKTIQLIKPTQGTPPRELTWEEWYNSPNQKKLAKNVTFGCGGAIKRSLK